MVSEHLDHVPYVTLVCTQVFGAAYWAPIVLNRGVSDTGESLAIQIHLSHFDLAQMPSDYTSIL